jgi:subtilisin family serine protease
LRRSALDIAERALPEDERWVFENAGFVFARTAQDISAAARMLTDAPSDTAVHRVFRNAVGQVLIETPRLLVRFKSRLKTEDVLAELGLRPLRALGFASNLFEVSAESGQALEASSPRASLIEYIEPEFLQLLPGRLRPTDPEYARQWQWRNTGASGGGVGADAHLEEAWERTLGRGVRLAVIDNGMDVNHEDLQAGIQGGGYFQDDGTGSGPFIPLTAGATYFPRSDHGTFCMGMAGARSNNNWRVLELRNRPCYRLRA